MKTTIHFGQLYIEGERGRSWGIGREVGCVGKFSNTLCTLLLKNFEPCSVNIFQVFLRKG